MPEPASFSLTHSGYTIQRELGRGGMATVYLATDLKHDRDVAIKVLRPDISAFFGSERFLREIRLAAQLQHPHILPLHDSGERTCAEGTVKTRKQQARESSYSVPIPVPAHANAVQRLPTHRTANRGEISEHQRRPTGVSRLTWARSGVRFPSLAELT